ncbi:GNAT family N-acetyltransferase [Wukongibacter baidiensis]|uniref:GNAT family N-acetyltransferase n=1 Tax=Wukongibacter baidiensis TaxID=1723361 RepID=UPI003D7FF439
MSKQYYLDCLDKGTKLYWRTLGKARGLELRTGDIEWIMSVPSGGAERIFSIRLPDDSLEDSMNELVNMIQKGEAPSGILITPSSKPDNIHEILSTAGFKINYDTGSGMAMDIGASVNHIEFNENIEILSVEDERTLEVWTEIVNTALFEEDLFSYEQFYDLFMLDNTYFYIGLFNGRPASTCMTITEGDIVTVEMVSTLKEYRKNGLGRAVTTVALQEMKNIGIRTAILRAEKEAVNIYKRIGFQEFYKRTVANYG